MIVYINNSYYKFGIQNNVYATKIYINYKDLRSKMLKNNYITISIKDCKLDKK